MNKEHKVKQGLTSFQPIGICDFSKCEYHCCKGKECGDYDYCKSTSYISGTITIIIIVLILLYVIYVIYKIIRGRNNNNNIYNIQITGNNNNNQMFIHTSSQFIINNPPHIPQNDKIVPLGSENSTGLSLPGIIKDAKEQDKEIEEKVVIKK